MDVVVDLVDDLSESDVPVQAGTRVTFVGVGSPCQVVTGSGRLQCERVASRPGCRYWIGVSTSPRWLHSAYVIAFDDAPAPLKGMYLSVDEPGRSLRVAPRPDGSTLLLVGGGGHAVGRVDSALQMLQELRDWTARHFLRARERQWWSAQDYCPVDSVPFVGALPRGGGKIFVATGFSKWGMTNAPAAAIRLAAEMLGGQLPWTAALRHRITGPVQSAKGVALNAEVAALLPSGWSRALTRLVPTHRPAEGAGIVGRGGAWPTAVSTVSGRTCAVSAVCSHLGGIVKWNDAEKTWDCPLHGSRFAPDGAALEGPATAPLTAREAP